MRIGKIMHCMKPQRQETNAIQPANSSSGSRPTCDPDKVSVWPSLGSFEKQREMREQIG